MFPKVSNLRSVSATVCGRHWSWSPLETTLEQSTRLVKSKNRPLSIFLATRHFVIVRILSAMGYFEVILRSLSRCRSVSNILFFLSQSHITFFSKNIYPVHLINQDPYSGSKILPSPQLYILGFLSIVIYASFYK
jgi:hypothetical protein